MKTSFSIFLLGFVMRTHKSLGGLFAILALAACVAGLRCKVLADLGVIPEYKIAVSGKVTDLKGSPVAGVSVVARIPLETPLWHKSLKERR